MGERFGSTWKSRSPLTLTGWRRGAGIKAETWGKGYLSQEKGGHMGPPLQNTDAYRPEACANGCPKIAAGARVHPIFP